MDTRWTVALAIVAVLSSARARADAKHPALHWSRAENASDCVDPRTLAELVETYTGPVLVAPGSADVSIEGEIERAAPDEFRVRVSVTVTRGAPSGRRVLTLRAADCRKLDGAIAFVIATTLDPDLGTGALPAELSWLEHSETAPGDQLREELARVEPTPPSQPSAASAVQRADSPTPAAIEDPPAESPNDDVWELGIAAAAGTGVVPKAHLGGLITFARTLGPAFGLTVQLRGNAVVGGFALEANRSVEVSTFGGALLACGRAAASRAFGMQACLGPEAGWFRASASGFVAAHSVVQPVYGGLLKLELRYELGDKLALTAAGLFGLGFRRPTVTYQELDRQPTVFRSELYSVQAALGLTRAF